MEGGRGRDMKVTDVKPFAISFQSHYPETKTPWTTHEETAWTFVKVETDEGIHGWGETGQGGKVESITAAVGELKRYLVGKDPSYLEHHWQTMYRRYAWVRGPFVLSAISGVEQALWDIVGKKLGQPVYNLMGGRCRDKIRTYCHVSRSTPELCAEQAVDYVRRGYTALKVDVLSGAELGFHSHWKWLRPEIMERAVDIFAKTREAVGDKIDLIIHIHGELNPAEALVLLKRLESYNPYWYEEPIQPENVDALAWIASHTHVPIATGERLFTRYDFREIFEKHAAAVVQPDPSYAGGIWETRKIAAMAEAYYTSFAPHCPLGPIANAVCMQLDACTPNFLIQEHWEGGHEIVPEITKAPPHLEDGCYALSLEPGLGIDLNEDALAKYPYQPKTMPGYLGYDDGTIFEPPTPKNPGNTSRTPSH
jgi:galactonate dehydratase